MALFYSFYEEGRINTFHTCFLFLQKYNFLQKKNKSNEINAFKKARFFQHYFIVYEKAFSVVPELRTTHFLLYFKRVFHIYLGTICPYFNAYFAIVYNPLRVCCLSILSNIVVIGISTLLSPPVAMVMILSGLMFSCFCISVFI